MACMMMAAEQLCFQAEWGVVTGPVHWGIPNNRLRLAIFKWDLPGCFMLSQEHAQLDKEILQLRVRDGNLPLSHFAR